MAELELESRLAELGTALEWPPTPSLRVAELLGSRPPVSPSRVRWLLALAAAILVALIAGGALSSPVRETVAGWLGLRQVEIHRVQQLPSPSPAVTGGAVSRQEASRLAGFPVRVPAALGQPSQILFEPSRREVTLVYPETVVTEARGTFPTGFVQKLVGPDTTIEAVTVNGRPGVWLGGHPHAIFYQDQNGTFVQGSLRLATTTLVWEEGGTVFRIEAGVSRERALAIAGTLQ